MPISSLVLELWQLSFIRDGPEIWKSEIPLSEFCPISGDCGKLGIPNLAQMSLIKCYWMLQNARVTAFTVFHLLWENQQQRREGEGWGGGKITTPLSTQVRVKHSFILWKCSTFFFINEFFKTQNLFGGMFFIKSYNQVFIMRYLFLPTGFYKVRVPDTCINNSYINL